MILAHLGMMVVVCALGPIFHHKQSGQPKVVTLRPELCVHSWLGLGIGGGGWLGLGGGGWLG